MIKKQVLSFILILSIVTSAFYAPLVYKPKKAEALFGILDITAFDVQEVVVGVLKVVAQQIAQKMIDGMVQSTVTWAQGGFEGNPAFVTDPGRFAGNIANDVAGTYINDLAMAKTGTNLCEPFKAKIVLSLAQYYNEYYGGGNYRAQCTFTGITSNLENFYEGTFGEAGGWETWFEVTQNPANNPYDQYFIQTEGLASQIASKVGIEKEQLNWGQGFKSKGDCIVKNPDAAALKNIREILDEFGPSGLASNAPRYDLSKEAGACLEYNLNSPGSLIKTQLDEHLSSSLSKLISAEQLDQLISSFATGLINKFLLGPGGLLGSNSRNSGSETARIGDRADTNPGNFIPICEKTSETLAKLASFLEFMKRKSFNKNDSYIWGDTAISTSGTVDNMLTTMNRFQLSEFDKPLSALGKYKKGLDEIVQSLAKDSDLATRSWVNYFPVTHILGIGHDSDNEKQQKLIGATEAIYKYLDQFNKEVLVGKCEDPEIEAIDTLDTPEFIDEPTNTGSTGNSDIISCSPNKTVADIGEQVIWSVNIAAGSRVTHTWIGLDTTNTSQTSVSVTYTKAGEKTAAVSASITDDTETTQITVVQCDSSVIISDPNAGGEASVETS